MFASVRLARAAALKARPFSSTSRAASETLSVIPFAFNAANLAFCNEVISRYPAQYKKAAMIPLLEIAQTQNKGWTSLSAMNEVARILEVPPMRVYEVASFYTMFNREPVGDYFVQICTTTPCMLGGCGSDLIVDTITKHLGVGLGQTTKDNKFTLLEVECLGACCNAPMVQINDKFYEDLTPETTISILDNLAAGKVVKTGPQSGKRQSSEPIGNRTSLIEPPPTTDQFCLPEWR
ncbi:NADH dehydrogenase (ubiquinone) flavoprotein 2, partial [Phenoliferia sp. Uapishka_3]